LSCIIKEITNKGKFATKGTFGLQIPMTMFQDLLPDTICDVVASQGYRPTGQLFQLNSYENRVYQVGLENHPPLVIKFYRPLRWNEAALCDEHLFIQELAKAEIPVVKPIDLAKPTGCPTLGYAHPYYYCLYPKFGGHEEADLSAERLQWLGRTLARVHVVGSRLTLKHRLSLTPKTYGFMQWDLLQQSGYLPTDLRTSIEDVILQCLKRIEQKFAINHPVFAVHGDCHLGNVLWNNQGPTLVDFDDALIAPPVQDIWMLFWGTPEEQACQRKTFFSGYEMFREFDDNSLGLVESLRTLRMIRHAAWIGQRFEEPIFTKTFSYYGERKYWEQFLLNLKEQWSLLQEPFNVI